MVEGGSVEAATELRGRLRSGFFDAVVGIGGGKTLDTAKHAAALSGLPMVAVATSLAHDGIASPVSSLEEGGRKASFGVVKQAQARGDYLPWMDRQTSFMSRPFLSEHGQYAAFTSRAPNLVAGDTTASIVQFAGKKRYSFAAGADFRMNPKYWNVAGGKFAPKPGTDPWTAIDDLNVHPEKYAIACNAA